MGPIMGHADSSGENYTTGMPWVLRVTGHGIVNFQHFRDMILVMHHGLNYSGDRQEKPIAVHAEDLIVP